jgi:hypothetical protein
MSEEVKFTELRRRALLDGIKMLFSLLKMDAFRCDATQYGACRRLVRPRVQKIGRVSK